jgi:hypothetical protein
MKYSNVIMAALAALLLSGSSYGQYAIPPQTRSQIAMDQLSRGATNNLGNVVYGLPAPPGVVVGDVYLDPVWNLGNVLLESGALLERYNVRYDLKAQTLEIQTSMVVKLLDYKLLRTVVWRDNTGTRLFVNASAYKLEGSPLVGILEVLSDGNKPLLRRTTMHVKQPDYVPALDVGSRDATIYKKSAVYYNNGGELIEVKGKKGILSALSDKGTEVEEYIKTNKLGTRSDFEIARIFDYYNSLFPQTDQE